MQFEHHFLTFNAIESITENKTTMGIEEFVLTREKQRGKAEGKAELQEEVVAKLISKLGFTNEQAADIAGVSVAFVAEIRKKLGL